MLIAVVTFDLAAAVHIRGAYSCGDWIQGRIMDRSHAEAWLIGYLSGRAVASDIDILKVADNPSLFLWMDRFCRANPLRDIQDGTLELIPELVRKVRGR